MSVIRTTCSSCGASSPEVIGDGVKVGSYLCGKCSADGIAELEIEATDGVKSHDDGQDSASDGSAAN
jgi:hypothetical protein